jgi:hypothetical protein
VNGAIANEEVGLDDIGAALELYSRPSEEQFRRSQLRLNCPQREEGGQEVLGP